MRFPNKTRVTPFVRALAGLANNRLSIEAPAPVGSDSISLTDFTLLVGGGLDVRVGERVSLRLIQFDYNPVFVRDRPERGVDARASTTSASRSASSQRTRTGTLSRYRLSLSPNFLRPH